MATRGALVLAGIVPPLLLCLLTGAAELYWGSYWCYSQDFLVVLFALTAVYVIAWMYISGGGSPTLSRSMKPNEEMGRSLLEKEIVTGLGHADYGKEEPDGGQENQRHLKRASERKQEKFRRFLEEKRTAMDKYIEELLATADEVDKFHKGAAIANVTGASASAAGGIAAIAGSVLAPFTLVISLILSAAGAVVAVAGVATKVASGVSETTRNKTDLRKVEKILRSCSEDIRNVFSALEEYENCIMTEEREEDREHLLRELQGIWQEFFNAENAGLCTGNHFNEDTMVLIKDVMRSIMMLIAGLLDDIIKAAVVAAAKGGAQAAAGTAAKATGIAGALFLPLDVYDIYKNARDIHRGAKTDLASRIREIVAKICSILNEPKHGFLAIKHK